LDPVKRLLLRDGELVSLTPKAFDTLFVLVQESGRVLEKDALMQHVWPNSFVEENNLTVNISMLRKVLGENRGENRYILTVPGKGYSFVADVREWWDTEADLVIEERTRERLVLEQEETQPVATTTTMTEGAGTTLALSAKGLNRWRSHIRVIALGLLLVGLVSAAAAYFLPPRKLPSAPTPMLAKRSIAVLPFRLISNKPDEQHLGMGIADIVITRLSNIKQLIVRPTSAIRKYNAPEQDGVVAGQELQVDSVLLGSVQQQDGRIRITVQLINVQNGASLWAEKFDEQMTNIFAVQDRISELVTQALAVKLTRSDEEMLAKRYTHDADAYQLYLKGRDQWEKRSKENLERSIDFFKQALEKDPNFALAYAGLADSYAMLASGGGEYSMQTRDAISNARNAVMEALRRDESLAEVHTSLGIIHLNYDWDWANAEKEFHRALELSPNSSNAHYWYSLYLSAMDRPEEAIAEARLAAEVEPLSPLIAAQVVRAFNYADRFDEAVNESRKALTLDPNRAVTHYTLGMAYRGLKRYGEAIEEFRKVIPFDVNSPIGPSAIGTVYALSGQRAEAGKILRDLQQKAQREYVSPYYFIDVYAGLGDRDQAFAWIEKAYEEHAGFLAYTRVDDIFDNLRSDPRYTDLLRRLGLAP